MSTGRSASCIRSRIRARSPNPGGAVTVTKRDALGLTSAGGDSFGYDAVGNQFARPGGVSVTYTASDLPKLIKQGALTLATFGYDGNQRRIRKTTPDKETLYFGDLYERVTTKKGAAKTEHRYYVSSPEGGFLVGLAGRELDASACFLTGRAGPTPAREAP